MSRNRAGRLYENGNGREQFQTANLQRLGGLIGNTAMQPFEILEPLSPTEQKVIEGISLGLSSEEVTESIHEFCAKNTKRKYYYPLRDKLHARSMPHAVRRAIENGIVPIGYKDIPDRLPFTKELQSTLELLSFGASSVEIAEVIGISPITVGSHILGIKHLLRANSVEHAVRVGFEDRLLTPSASEPLAVL